MEGEVRAYLEGLGFASIKTCFWCNGPTIRAFNWNRGFAFVACVAQTDCNRTSRRHLDGSSSNTDQLACTWLWILWLDTCSVGAHSEQMELVHASKCS